MPLAHQSLGWWAYWVALMPLSQKELEDFVWEQPRFCVARGLAMRHSFFALGRRYRQLPLGPYGVAQQVSVRFLPEAACYYVQVVLSTTGAIGARLYLRAKQELSALNQLLPDTAQGTQLNLPQLTCVLIGRRVELAGNFVYALNLDASCQAFTYQYNATGLHFHRVSKGWSIPGSEQAPELQVLSADLLTERADALAISQAARAAWLLNASTKPADPSDLVVTANGVIQAGGLLGKGQFDE